MATSQLSSKDGSAASRLLPARYGQALHGLGEQQRTECRSCCVGITMLCEELHRSAGLVDSFVHMQVGPALVQMLQ